VCTRECDAVMLRKREHVAASPTARANGTVRPSAMHDHDVGTISVAVKCFSTWGVVGIVSPVRLIACRSPDLVRREDRSHAFAQ
jgi:hypothetical protein